MNVGTFANQSQCMLDPHEFQQRLQSTSKEPPRAHGCRRFPDYAGLKFVLSKCHKFESCMKCQRPRRRISQRASASDGPPPIESRSFMRQALAWSAWPQPFAANSHFNLRGNGGDINFIDGRDFTHYQAGLPRAAARTITDSTRRSDSFPSSLRRRYLRRLSPLPWLRVETCSCRSSNAGRMTA
jgi:hypothetical protein